MHDHAAAEVAIKCCIIAIGDDMLAVCESRDAPALCSSFERELTSFGFQPKAKWTVVKERAEFCSSYLATTDDGNTTLVPLTGKQLLKLTRARDLSHAAAITVGVMSSPDPLLRDAFEAVGQRVRGIEPSNDDDRDNKYKLGNGSRLASRSSVRERYGVDSLKFVPIGDYWPGQCFPSMPSLVLIIRALWKVCLKLCFLILSQGLYVVLLCVAQNEVLTLMCLITTKLYPWRSGWKMSVISNANIYAQTSNSRFPAGSASTKDGSDWLTCVTDPYHDNNLRVAGVPSAQPSFSYTRQYKQRLALQRPTGAAFSGNWDCHIFFSDVMDRTWQYRSTRSATGYQAHGGLSERGLITIVHVPTGESLNSGNAVWTSMPLDLPFSVGARVIGAAFEVHDTTPEMYRGGAITCWKAAPVRVQDYTATTGLGPSPASVTSCTGVPSTLELANMLPTSRTWRASEGALVVAQPDFTQMEFQKERFGNAFLECETTDELDGAVGLYSVSSADAERARFRSSGLVCSGIIVSAQGEFSTLTLDCRVLVECSPGMDHDELALCTPTAQYDPVALATAMRIFHVIPPGVEVKHNSFGSWFKNILSVASKVLPIVATIVPHAGAKAIMGGLAAASGAGAAAMGGSNTPRSVLPATSGRMVESRSMVPRLISHKTTQRAKAAKKKA